MRKVDPFDFTARLGDHNCERKLYGLEMRLNGREDVRRQCIQQKIGRLRQDALPALSGSAVTSLSH
jgi:hypothetical protein